jgi:hypothetical protein
MAHLLMQVHICDYSSLLSFSFQKIYCCVSRWVLDIFKLGFKKDLETEDLYETLDEHRSEFLGNKLEG